MAVTVKDGTTNVQAQKEDIPVGRGRDERDDSQRDLQAQRALLRTVTMSGRKWRLRCENLRILGKQEKRVLGDCLFLC